MIILKAYYDVIKNSSSGNPREILDSYGDQLENEGWIYSMMDAGYISPDCAVLFVTDRSPYYGQLLCLDYDLEPQFESYKKSMIESGLFVET